MAQTSVIRCKCVHKDQDEMYGKGMRIHNVCKQGKGWRCTVCQDVKQRNEPGK